MTSYAAACCCEEEGGPGCETFASLDFDISSSQSFQQISYNGASGSTTTIRSFTGTMSGSCGLRSVSGLGNFSSTHPSLNNPQASVSYSELLDVRGQDTNGCGEEFYNTISNYDGGPVEIIARLNEGFGLNARSIWPQGSWNSNDYCGFELDPNEYGRIASVYGTFTVDGIHTDLSYSVNCNPISNNYTFSGIDRGIGTFASLYRIGDEEEPCDAGSHVADSGLFCIQSSGCGTSDLVPFCESHMLPRSYTVVDDRTEILDGEIYGKIDTYTVNSSGSITNIQFHESNPYP
tara:strand:- start:1228 stop:2100 length:873 start_codon:yes stop_codon:yes gene_type:complete